MKLILDHIDEDSRHRPFDSDTYVEWGYTEDTLFVVRISLGIQSTYYPCPIRLNYIFDR